MPACIGESRFVLLKVFVGMEACLLQGCCFELTHLFSLAICLTCALRYEVSESRR